MIYFHNFTTGQVNETDIEIAAEWFDVGDSIYLTMPGNGLVLSLESNQDLIKDIKAIIYRWKLDLID